MELATAIAALIREYGWQVGLFALLGAGFGWALRGWHREKDARLKDRDQVKEQIIKLANDATTALLTSSQTFVSRTAALESLSASILDVGAAVKGMTATNDVQIDRMMDRLDEVLREVRRS